MRLHHSPDGAAHDILMTFAAGTTDDNNNDDQHLSPPPPPQEPNAYTDPLDDVFGSAPPSPTPQGTESHAVDPPRRDVTDIPRLRSVHVTNGYREGLSASKAAHVQAGFDEGYGLGAELGMKVGWVLGALEGMVRAVGAGGEGQDGEGLLSREELRAELARAEEEMGMRRVFGEEFFGGDGVWRYAVPGAEGEGEESVTFEAVAKAHPLVVQWEGKVRELAERLGLSVG